MSQLIYRHIFRNNVDNLQDAHIVDHQDFSCYCMAIYTLIKNVIIIIIIIIIMTTITTTTTTTTNIIKKYLSNVYIGIAKHTLRLPRYIYINTTVRSISDF